MGLWDSLAKIGGTALQFVPGGQIPGAILAGVGGALSNRGGTQNQNQTSTTNQNTNFTNQGNNTYYGQNRASYADPASAQYNQALLQNAYSRMGQGVVDPGQFARSTATQNIQGLNAQGELQRKVVENVMRQRGLAYSPMGATMQGNLEAGRVAQGVGYINQIPQLERQAMMENEQILNNRQSLLQQLLGLQLQNQENEGFQNTWNTGQQQQQGTTTGNVQTQIPGNMLGGALASLGQYYGNIAGYNNFRPENKFQLPSNPTPQYRIGDLADPRYNYNYGGYTAPGMP